MLLRRRTRRAGSLWAERPWYGQLALPWVSVSTTRPVPTHEGLRSHLISSGIAGHVATPREANLTNYLRMSRRDPLYLLGLRPAGAWTPAEVLALMAKRCGVSPDHEHRSGQDTIDADRTIERLDAMAARLHVAVERRERVLVVTGHPIGLRPIHTGLAHALTAAGCTLLTPAAGWQHPSGTPYAADGATIGYLDGVGMMMGPDRVPMHTHSPLPMCAVLAELEAAEPPPDLVIADHGWAGAAGQAGVDTIGFADCNDPALFVGEAEGRVMVCVPLDDNLSPQLYAPLTAYLLSRAGLLE